MNGLVYIHNNQLYCIEDGGSYDSTINYFRKYIRNISQQYATIMFNHVLTTTNYNVDSNM